MTRRRSNHTRAPGAMDTILEEAGVTELDTFTITESHIKLLRRTNIDWNDREYGAPCMNCKRPYGNGDVEGDIAEILGWGTDDDGCLSEEQGMSAHHLHREMQIVLQILVNNPLGLNGEWKRVGNKWEQRF